jgi:hypothetical protein
MACACVGGRAPGEGEPCSQNFNQTWRMGGLSLRQTEEPAKSIGNEETMTLRKAADAIFYNPI